MPTLSPASRSYRARVASLTRSRQPDDPDLIGARRSLEVERLAEHVERLVSSAPPLTSAQRDRLAVLLSPRECDRGDVG